MAAYAAFCLGLYLLLQLYFLLRSPDQSPKRPFLKSGRPASEVTKPWLVTSRIRASHGLEVPAEGGIRPEATMDDRLLVLNGVVSTDERPIAAS